MLDPRKKIQLLISSLEELRLHVGRKDLAVGKQRVNALLFFSLANASLRGSCLLLYGGMGANKTTLVNLLGWKRLAELADLMLLDRVILGFLRDYWGTALPSCSRPDVDLLGRVFSPGIRERSLRQRQCRQTAKILEPFLPGILGRGLDQMPGDLERQRQ